MTIALLIIDMQNDHVGKIVNAKNMIKNILLIKKIAKENSVPVIYSKETHKENEKEFKKFGPHTIKGTKGWKIIDELEPEEGNIITEKQKFSAFFKTNLDSILSEKNTTKILITGINLNCCVMATALDGFNYDYEVFIIKEAVSLRKDRLNFEKSSFEWINAFCGKVISMKEAMDIIKTNK